MRSRCRLVLTIAAATLGLGVLAAPAGAASKPFSMVVAPASAPAGQSTSFSVTLTNRTSQQQLGSADITVASAFTAVSVADPPGAATATTNGNVVQLRNAGVEPGGSMVVSVTATVPTTCMATYAWSVVAKQANDFNGPPGNDLTLDPATSSLTTSVAGGCALRFVAGRQPAASRVNQTISALDYQPGGPSVQVEVVDGAGQRVTTSTASITVALGPSTGTGTLHGTLTVSASAGVASFGNLSIDAPGTYTLRATSAGLSATTSSTFRVDQVAVACIEDVTCSASIANGSTTFDVTASGNAGTDAGFLILDNGIGVAIDCAGYSELTATPTVIEGPDRAKTVTSTIDKRVMNAQPNNGASFLQMCFGAPYTFATRPGSALTGVDTDGNGINDFFYALLPDCGAPPCVSSRKKTNAGDGVIVTQTPGGTQDPAYRP
jgi:hypothetical protein